MRSVQRPSGETCEHVPETTPPVAGNRPVIASAFLDPEATDALFGSKGPGSARFSVGF